MAVMAGTAAHMESHWSKETLAWASLHEPCLKPLWLAILKTGCVGWQTRFLDVGCGTGGALMLGRGLGAALAGIDTDEERIRFAKNRVRGGDIRSGKIQKLPYGDGCATFAMSLDLISNPRPAEDLVAELCRVCSSRGKVAIAVWGDSARTGMAAMFDAMGETNAFRYSAEAALKELAESSCGKVHELFECEAPFVYPTIDAAWIVQRNLGWGRRAIEEKGPVGARTAFLGAIRRFTDASGRVCMNNHFRFAIFKKA